MGGCCSTGDKSSSSGAFSQPGRVLGSAPQQPERASVPSNITQGRTIGSGGGASSGAASGGTGDARSAAAKAAEERAAKATTTQGKGKLGQALATQKKETMTSTLGAASAEERRRRDLDQNAEARNWN